MAVDLLQQVGVVEYRGRGVRDPSRPRGRLTGYELGKRSAVPLSRSYETLERLIQWRAGVGAAPGDPPRYLAEPAARFLAQTRDLAQGTVLAALAEARPSCSGPTRPTSSGWCVGGPMC